MARIVQKAAAVVATPTQEAVAYVEQHQAPQHQAVRVDLTKYQFRQLFTFAERRAIDNLQYNPDVSGGVKATVFTFQKDMELSGVIELGTPSVTAGVNFLTAINLISQARANRILANLPPETI